MNIPNRPNETPATELETEILEIVMADDARYFEQHPGERQYRRAYVPGETPGHVLPAGTVCTVTQIAPGRRSRNFEQPAPRFRN